MKLIKIAIACATLATALPASASVVVDGSPTGLTYGNWANEATSQNFLVKFTLAATTNITGFDIFTENYFGSIGQAVRVRIRADASGSPTAANLFSFDDTIDVSTAFAGTTNTVGTNFSSISLGAGTYWIGMSGLTSELGWTSFNNGGPSANPNQRQLSNETVISTPGIYDLGFRIRSDDMTAPVPEPATWMLMLMGMAGVGFVMRRKEKQTVRVRYS